MLKIDHGHKSIDVSKIKKSGVKILSQLMGATIALTMYSGFASVKASAASYTDDSVAATDSYSDSVDIPENYRGNVLECLGRTGGSITHDDLANMNKLELLMVDGSDSLDFVNECQSIDELYLASISRNIDSIADIDKLSNLETFTFDNGQLPIDLNCENCKFLFNNSNIKTLRLYGNVMLEPELVYSMPNLESVAIEVTENTPLDLTRISTLKEAYIYGDPYDIAINVSVDDVQELMNRGVEVFLNSDSYSEMLKIEDRLADIIDCLDIDEKSTDQEKLDQIILYVLENFSYDPGIENLSAYDSDRDDKIGAFYDRGYLYGALEKNTQICGNYAALVSALSKRVGIDSYMMMSEAHSWNLVQVDGEYYYLDTTWMDNNLHTVYTDGLFGPTTKEEKAEQLFKENNTQYLDWYMDEPLSYYDSDHRVYNFPSYLTDEVEAAAKNGIYSDAFDVTVDTPETPTEIVSSPRVDDDYTVTPVAEDNYETTNIENIDEQNVPDISQQEFEVTVDGKQVVIPGAILVGVMAALGAAKLVNKKKKKNMINNYDNDNNLKM